MVEDILIHDEILRQAQDDAQDWEIPYTGCHPERRIAGKRCAVEGPHPG